MIKKIQIRNVKGIGNGAREKILNLDIYPNKPSILLAPNGFGKSSISTAFRSMNRDRIKLDEKDYHEGNSANLPYLKLTVQKVDGSLEDLEADENSNTISSYFDFFVINSQLRAKGVGQAFGGRVNVTASLNIDDIYLIENIPGRIDLNYSLTNVRLAFGASGKVLPNLNSIFGNSKFFSSLLDNEIIIAFDRSNNTGVIKVLNDFKTAINNQVGTRNFLISWIRTNWLDLLKNTPYFSTIAERITQYDLGFSTDREIESFLAAMQLQDLYHHDRNHFKNFCRRKNYEWEKEGFTKLFEDFNSSWVEFKPKEKDYNLVLEFPKAHLISNGQRDVLSFVAMLERARKKLKKDDCILVIDEVFDYLDDANLTSVQYYLSQFIEEFISSTRRIYPLILTHLDPEYFKGHVFGKKLKLKVYYLSQSNAIVNQHLKAILRERNKKTSPLKLDIEKLLLHFHTTPINKRNEFRDAQIAELWGEQDNFDRYVYEEARKYCNDESNFDPLAVCCAVRKKIEEKVFAQITNANDQNIFLNEMNGGTNEKLDFADSIGINVNDSYYYLGLIYNEALHWKDNRDDNANISPAMEKLKNLTIKKLIKGVFA